MVRQPLDRQLHSRAVRDAAADRETPGPGGLGRIRLLRFPLPIFLGLRLYLVQVNRYVQQRASLAKPPHHRSSARILRSAMSGSTVLDARCIYLGSTPAAVITDRTRRFRELRVSAGPMFAPCLLGCRGTARQRAAPRGSPVSRFAVQPGTS